MTADSSVWLAGSYTVAAICMAYGATETATTQFYYEVPV